MNEMSIFARLTCFAAAAATMLILFETVILSSETLPDVKIARAIQSEGRLAMRNTLVAAAAQTASSVR